jgi:Predicted membrane protein (DUF2231)
VAAMWLILVGVLGAAAAAIFGTLDLLNLPRRTAAFRTGQIHAALNSAALVIFLINFIWRSNTRDSWEATPIGPLVLSIIGIAVIGASGFLGGKARLPLRRSGCRRVGPGRGIPRLTKIACQRSRATQAGGSGGLGPAENLRCLKLGESRKGNPNAKRNCGFSADHRSPLPTARNRKIATINEG